MTLTHAAQDTTVTVTVKKPGTSWTVTCSDSTVTVSPLSGIGNDTLTISLPENNSLSVKSFTITVSDGKATTQTISVTQKGTSIVMSDKSFTVQADSGSTDTLFVTTFSAWKLHLDDTSWVTSKDTSGSTDDTITFIATATNPRAESRTVTGYVATASDTIAITITQEGAAPYVIFTKDTVTLGNGKDSTLASFSTNALWAASSSVDWISISKTTGDDSDSVQVTVAINTVVAKRTGYVIITADGAADTLVVQQAGATPVLAVSATDAMVEAADGSTTTTGVTANTDWAATTKATWFAVSQDATSGSGLVTVTAQANPAVTQRTDTVYVSMAGVTTLKIVVTQEGTAIAQSGNLAQFTSSKDNTVIQTDAGTAGNSRGLIYVGSVDKTSNIIRRGLVMFDVSGVLPQYAVLDSVKLDMSLQMASASTIKMYQVTSDWGEGTSYGSGGMGAAATTNDVTWLHSFYNTSNWTTAGGDFASNATDSVTITSATRTISLTNDAMKTNVESWLSGTTGNYGWLLKASDETSASKGVMTKIYSRETSANASQEPTLSIYFSSPTLAVPSNSIALQAAAVSKSMEVTANTAWTASEDADWLSVSPSSGTSRAEVTFTAQANESLTERSTVVKLEMTGAETISITVTQAGATPVLAVSATEASVSVANGSQAAITVTSNTSWTLTAAGDWFSVSPTAGTGDATITIQATGENTATTRRTGTFTLQATDCETITVTVTQDARTGIEASTAGKITVYPVPARGTIHVRSTAAIEQVELYDMAGALLKTGRTGTLDVSGLSAGMYAVAAYTAGGKKTVAYIVVGN